LHRRGASSAERFANAPEDHGYRLYVVKADERSERPGDAIGAGVGWYQWADGRGVFVEHELVGEDSDAVEGRLRHPICCSLRDLCLVREVPFDERRVRMRVEVTPVEDRPSTVLVLAVFQAKGR
jgi:hypothetical protein